MTTRLRAAEQVDVPTIAELHLAAFPNAFTTLLGSRFLRGYYSTVISADHGIALVADTGSDLAGFAVGSAEPAALYENLYQSRLRLAQQMLRPVARRPMLAPRLGYAFASTRQRRVATCGNSAELSSLAVSAGHRRGGVGVALVTAFCEEAARRGARTVMARTPLAHNDAVLAFYSRLDFRETARELQGIRRVIVCLTSADLPGVVPPDVVPAPRVERT